MFVKDFASHSKNPCRLGRGVQIMAFIRSSNATNDAEVIHKHNVVKDIANVFTQNLSTLYTHHSFTTTPSPPTSSIIIYCPTNQPVVKHDSRPHTKNSTNPKNTPKQKPQNTPSHTPPKPQHHTPPPKPTQPHAHTTFSAH